MIGEDIRDASKRIEMESGLRFPHAWPADLDALERGNQSYLDAKGQRIVAAALAEARAGA